MGQSPNSDAHRYGGSSWPAAVTAALALAGGTVSLAGWWAGIPRWTDWVGTGVSMYANAALGVAAAGAAILLIRGGNQTALTGARLLGCLVGLLGIATLLQHLTGVSFGIDTLLSSHPWGNRGAIFPGRPGPPASLGFCLIGPAIVLASGTPGGRRAVPFIGLAVGAISLTPLLGYLFHADDLYMLPRYTGIAPQTALMLLSLAVALIWTVPEHPPLSIMRERSGAGILARRTLPVIFSVPIVLGWIRVWLQDAAIVDTGMGTAVLVIALIALLCLTLGWSIIAVRANEAALRERTSEIEALNARLQRAMSETHHRVKNNLQVIAALVDIRAMGAASDAHVAELKRIGHHIQSLATIHDLLTSQVNAGEDSGAISSRDVIDRLAPLLRSIIGSREIHFEVENILLEPRQGTSLAVLVNELVNNAVKHGAGDIDVSRAVVSDRARLQICDRGPGFEEGFDPHKSAGTGMQLIQSVSTVDLQGVTDFQNREGGGATVVVDFPRPHKSPGGSFGNSVENIRN
jgi:two-component sensor histidine kinase